MGPSRDERENSEKLCRKHRFFVLAIYGSIGCVKAMSRTFEAPGEIKQLTRHQRKRFPSRLHATLVKIRYGTRYDSKRSREGIAVVPSSSIKAPCPTVYRIVERRI